MTFERPVAGVQDVDLRRPPGSSSEATDLDDLLGWSAQISYYFFLALFPALICFVALASFFPIEHLTGGMLGRKVEGNLVGAVAAKSLAASSSAPRQSCSHPHGELDRARCRQRIVVLPIWSLRAHAR